MRHRTAFIVAAAGFLALAASQAAPQVAGPAEGTLVTRWAKDVTPERVHPEYPRPQMVRDNWQNLNGHWDYAIRPREEGRPDRFDGPILVPFPVESTLSGVKKRVGEASRLWYRRSFAARRAPGQRLLLHFGAVDWHAVVWVNGKQVGEHKGGYDPFTFDITDALNSNGQQELVVSVWDPTDKGSQPRGKQVSEPQGIWYTPVTGIWQTVWLEPVPAASIAGLKPVPDVDAGSLRLWVQGRHTQEADTVRAVAREGKKVVATATGTVGGALALSIARAKLWSPDSPFLYDLQVTLLREGRVVDEVRSYFGMRKIALGRDKDGYNRLLLNNQPLFHFGPLDQGWWPDGLYTAPTDEALRYDVEVTKRLRFNLARKHVKVEPARWYYWCDKLGLLVWQDMPNGHPFRGMQISPTAAQDAQRDPDSARQFEAELKAVLDACHHFPCIVMWVPFNEGWGQYDTARIAAWVKDYDPSRLVNSASGWTDRGVGDVHDVHMYPGPGIEPGGPKRAAVLGEFGGLGLPMEGHLWWNKRNWGYRTYQTRDQLNQNYQTVVENLYGLLGRGLAAAIYTQTTDVEGEVNGLMTYDRAVIKFDPAELTRLHRPFYQPPPSARILLPSSKGEPQSWRYVLEQPSEGWQGPGFEDTEWKQGSAPFAWPKSNYFPLGTPWQTGEIWCRQTFTVDERPPGLWLEVYHDVEAASVYLNGKRVAELTGATSRHYGHVKVREPAGVLQPGKNTLAVHARKPKGNRGIDVGIYAVGSPGK
jgi:hypothetical protein